MYSEVVSRRVDAAGTAISTGLSQHRPKSMMLSMESGGAPLPPSRPFRQAAVQSWDAQREFWWACAASWHFSHLQATDFCQPLTVPGPPLEVASRLRRYPDPTPFQTLNGGPPPATFDNERRNGYRRLYSPGDAQREFWWACAASWDTRYTGRDVAHWVSDVERRQLFEGGGGGGLYSPGDAQRKISWARAASWDGATSPYRRILDVERRSTAGHLRQLTQKWLPTAFQATLRGGEALYSPGDAQRKIWWACAASWDGVTSPCRISSLLEAAYTGAQGSAIRDGANDILPTLRVPKRTVPSIFRRQSFLSAVNDILRRYPASWDTRYTGRDVAIERMRLAPRSCETGAQGSAIRDGANDILPTLRDSSADRAIHFCQPFTGARACCLPPSLPAISRRQSFLSAVNDISRLRRYPGTHSGNFSAYGCRTVPVQTRDRRRDA
ncbi:hypothetical protein GGX14DRAFT_404506 [Mycena pura]|uniref:Uncharacterized protein n=1 Tax=Mycena pura TaxID=153505 RepID=A0AAD6UUL2_9AGAR|nr:hypothetical protein GGX14DRAFT_404506 [Mycena pura]